MADEERGQAGVPDLTAIVVNWNTCAELRSCLRSVMESDSVSAETMVVDNASSDGSAEMVREEFPSVRLLVNAENLGFAKGCNQGIAISRGRYVLLLNSDSDVQSDALSALVRFGDENPDVGIFGPRILNSDGSLQYSCRRFPTLLAGIFRNSFLGRLFPKNPYIKDYLLAEWDHSETRDVDWVSGAAMVIRREVLEEVGALDERFFMYCEDVDLAYRAKQHGWRVAYFPAAVVVHALGRSSDKDPNGMIAEFHKSMYRFFRKHYARKSSVLVRLLVPVGLAARAAFLIGRNHFNRARSVLRRRTRASTAERQPACTRSRGKGRSGES